jgi:hypothetical protein
VNSGEGGKLMQDKTAEAATLQGNDLNILATEQYKDTIKFQYYRAKITESEPIGWVTLDQFIKANSNPSEPIKELFKKIQYSASIGDSKTKQQLKEKLYSFTPCVNVSVKRAYNYIISFTGLLVLDFDKIDNAADFKEYLFNEYDFIYLCWISPSKRGVKALVKIPVVNTVNQFKAYYFGIAEEMEQYNGFDSTGQNSVLPLYQSYDPKMLIRENPKIWNTTGIKRNEFILESNIETKLLPCDYTGKEKVISKIIHTGIDKIKDNGHPQLRSICLAIGGYVANQYMNFNDAMDIIYNRIESNHYLQKGISGYKQTAKWAVLNGTSRPLTLHG